ncbi:hypothetical protein GGS24DRAFT_506587 [Hypoxylon argillaceum]|nr:hypothetical protein GGS24DRAFT_506587 [Hypoxylon argillaceum]
MKYIHDILFPISRLIALSPSRLQTIVTLIFCPNTILILILLFKSFIEVSELLDEIAILAMNYIGFFLSYSAHLALIGLGWALQPFEPDAADLYLSFREF